MATDIVIPSDLWEGDDEAGITAWLVNDGASVTEGALIAEVMVMKTQYQIHAPAGGTVRIVKALEAVVAKGDVIARIE